MKICSIFFAFTCALLTCSCSALNRDGQYISGASSFYLSPQQLDENYYLATKNADPDAAFRLYQYYSFFKCDEESSSMWLRKAAGLGHKMAIQHLEVKCESEGAGSGGVGEESSNPFE